MLNLWIDDLRDPKHSLNDEKLKDLVWKKEAWEARKYHFETAETELETLYLDNFLGDRRVTGELILGKLSYKITKPGAFPKLKTIYLHTSDDKVLDRCLDMYTEKFKDRGIKLLKADYYR